MRVIQENPLEAILQTDIVAKMQGLLTENIDKLRQQVSDIESKTSNTERLREQLKTRLKCKAKRAPEMMLTALDELISQLPAQKAMMEQLLAKLERMLELLEDYSFKFDAPPPRPTITAMPMQFVTLRSGSW